MTAFSEIGEHIIRGGVKPALLATAPVITLVDCDTAYIREVCAVNPNAWKVVRWVYRESQEDALEEPDAAAQRWFNQRRAEIEAVKGPRVVFQGMNEISCSCKDAKATAQTIAYAKYEYRRMKFLHGIGAGFGLGSWSVGEPDYPAWAYFAMIMTEMTRERDAVLLHEYWPDRKGLEERWYTARWTDDLVWRWIKGQNIIVTECGRDRVDGRGKPGWRLTVNAETYMSEIARYNELCEETPAVLGACLFTGGMLGEWANFEVNSLWPRIAAMQTPEPEPTPGALPEHEQGNAALLAEKTVWWTQEAVRYLEQSGEPPESRAMRILYSLIAPDKGLAIRLREALEDHVTIASQWESRTIDDAGAVTTTNADGVGTFWVPPRTTNTHDSSRAPYSDGTHYMGNVPPEVKKEWG